jgi:hypothetical protein
LEVRFQASPNQPRTVPQICRISTKKTTKQQKPKSNRQAAKTPGKKTTFEFHLCESDLYLWQ